MARILITGCGRAGTQYSARLLAACGLRVTHEHIYRQDLDPANPQRCAKEIDRRWTGANHHKRWTAIDAEASWFAAPFVTVLPPDVVVWHQLRDPLHILRCWHHNDILMGGESAEYVWKVLPETQHGKPLARGVEYVYRWNQLVEQAVGSPCYRRYRVEDLTADLLCDLLEYSNVAVPVPVARVQEAFAEIKPGVGACTQTHKELDADELAQAPLWPQLRQMRQRYGYGG